VTINNNEIKGNKKVIASTHEYPSKSKLSADYGIMFGRSVKGINIIEKERRGNRKAYNHGEI